MLSMKIHNKLFLVFFSFSLLLVIGLVLLIQWSISKGLVDYVNSKEIESLSPLIAQLEYEYKQDNSWQSMQGQNRKFGDFLFNHLQGELRREVKPVHDLPPHRRGLPIGEPRHALLDTNKNVVAGHFVKNVEYNEIALKSDDINIGWLIVPKYKRITDGYELDFIDQQKSYLWIIALVTMFLVAIITLPLAHHLADPIKKIISGMHKLTQGDYQQSIKVKRKDELGDLSRDFNVLAHTLNENDNARKRWLANISHELRTPVAILRGELEAMLDGVRKLDKTNVGSANDEVKHLQNLIDDLHQLTSADIGGFHYHKQVINIREWLNTESNKYAVYLADNSSTLVLDIQSEEAYIFADHTRLCQLFENLINNCIKYAHASIVNISLVVKQGLVRIKVEDNGGGVSEKHLPHLFEYLYRVDDSRNRKTGGVGLGLSICAHIVAAHQGTIEAERSEELGGLGIVIELPIQD